MNKINKRSVSGVRPTGKLHLGNYFGAIQQFIELQNKFDECFFFVADMHALTTAIEDNLNIDKASIDVVRMYLACGVDANKAFIYRQSDIPEIVQLYFLLSMITPVGELQRCTTYKDKVANMESNKKLISLGLLSYPALMAADILFANAQIVPVGKDQEQHLEITREIARKYNHHFAKNIRFSEPQNLTTKSIKVPGLLNGKMSKSVGSEDNVIYLLDDEKTIRRKIKGAKTDSGPVESQEMGEDMKNIFQLMSLCCKKDIYKKFLDKYNNCETKFYGDLKNSLADAVVEMLAPIQDRYYNSSECSEESVKQILVEHTRVVRPIAQRTLRAVQQDLGFNDLALKI